MSKPATHCCQCRGPFGEHVVATRWPGSKDEYCLSCWNGVGQFRAVIEIGAAQRAAVVQEGEAA